MKKFRVVLLFVVGVLSFTTIFSGCSPSSGKKEIGVSIYNGGHGIAWAEDLAKKFMDENPNYNETYEIVFYPEKKSELDIMNEMSMSGSYTQMAITSANKFQDGIYNKNCFADLTDVVSRKVDGDDRTIRDKIQNYETWTNIYSKRGEGLYAVPYADSIMGLVIDHQLFIDKGWYEFATEAADAAALEEQGITYSKAGGRLIFESSLNTTNYKSGDKILSRGKDGKFGTYDDGQPVDIAGWEIMLEKIDADQSKCFMCAGGAKDYTNFILYALFAQYEGLTGWNAYFNYDSNGENISFINSDSGVYQDVMTVEKGYKINEIEGVYKAYEFMFNYMCPNESLNSKSAKWMHHICTSSVISHTDAQSYYLTGLGKEGDTNNPQTAMLVEGAWWEYEASTTFNDLGKLDSSRGYGKREYRYMLLPKLDGQKSGNKSYFASCETGVMLVGKDEDTERLKCTKDFIAYLLKDDSLSYFTGVTGTLMMYDYDIKESDYAKLTPFAKNLVAIYNDKTNIEIVRSRLSCLESPLSYASERGSNDIMNPKFNGTTRGAAINVIDLFNLSDIKQGLMGFYSQAKWQSYIDAVRSNGFDI